MSVIIEIKYKIVDCDEIDTMVPGDYIIDAVNGGYNIFQHEGKDLNGLFPTLDNALKAIEKDMRKNEFFPNIFVQSERGHVDQLVAKMDLDN